VRRCSAGPAVSVVVGWASLPGVVLGGDDEQHVSFESWLERDRLVVRTSILRPAALLASAQDELHTYLDASQATRTSPTSDGDPIPAAAFTPDS
ncbi:hypothetical protein NQU55_36070, partial [Streptomyces sp. AA8]|nr:hypothetical protein [Streptomyces telluris]